MNDEKESSVTAEVCPPITRELARGVMVRFGDRWSVTVISALLAGPRRFGELQTGIGDISHRVLTMTLRSLQRDGLVEREEFDEMPRRVVYGMTELGRSLADPITAIIAWAHLHAEDVATHRTTYDLEREAFTVSDGGDRKRLS